MEGLVRGESTTAQRLVSPAKIQQYLKGAHYPSSKQNLVELAKKNNAPDDVMSTLELMPDKEYGSPVQVMKEIGKKA